MLAITMPTPPTRLTSKPFSIRSTTPRLQSTTLPAALAGSSVPAAQSAASVSVADASLDRDRCDQRSRGGQRRRRRRADVAGAVAQLDGLERAAERAGSDRGQPRARVVERAGARTAVAGRVGDEDARVGGGPEGLLHRVEDVGLGAAADRVVDDVDAVEHGLVDRGHAVGAEAAGVDAWLAFPADLVGRDLGSGRHARAGADGLAVDGDVGAVVAGSGRRGVRAVSGAVAG